MIWWILGSAAVVMVLVAVVLAVLDGSGP